MLKEFQHQKEVADYFLPLNSPADKIECEAQLKTWLASTKKSLMPGGFCRLARHRRLADISLPSPFFLFRPWPELPGRRVQFQMRSWTYSNPSSPAKKKSLAFGGMHRPTDRRNKNRLVAPTKTPHTDSNCVIATYRHGVPNHYLRFASSYISFSMPSPT